MEWVSRPRTSSCAARPGTGKKPLLEALGHAAIEAGHHRRLVLLEDLGTLVRRHRVDDTVSKAIQPDAATRTSSSSTTSGCCPISADAAEGLYRLVDAAYERRSLAVLQPPPLRVRPTHGQNLATALVDRLLHHAHVIVTEGDSVRLTDATQGKGVKPLTT